MLDHPQVLPEEKPLMRLQPTLQRLDHGGALAPRAWVEAVSQLRQGVGVVFNRWSGALKTAGQGLAWRVPWVTQVQSYPVALRTYTMVRRGAEGAVQGDDSLDLPTKEGQHIRQDISVTYNTSQEKAADVFRSFRGAEIGDIEGTFIRRTIITTAQNAAGQMSLTDLISFTKKTQKTPRQELKLALTRKRALQRGGKR
jgi:phage-related protein